MNMMFEQLRVADVRIRSNQLSAPPNLHGVLRCTNNHLTRSQNDEVTRLDSDRNGSWMANRMMLHDSHSIIADFSVPLKV
mmetsp:Transcript_5303/g.12181  ORF Transcript_5303/g.12181 Transcript_5303/m.12181 type:complete len:80 (-) Transcript_5303:1032-1271(-)